MKDNRFKYTYCAPTEAERREISDIRMQYSNERPTEDRLARLRRLDARVKNLATLAGLVPGVVGLLIFGLGLATVLEWGMILLGVLFAVLGALPMLAAYPLSRIAFARARAKYGPEILRLSEELLGKGGESTVA